MATKQRKVSGIQTGEGVFIYHEDDEFVFCDKDGNEAHFKDLEQLRKALEILAYNA